MDKKFIVKRRGHSEAFDERKAYGSIYFACRSAHLGEQEAEKLAEKTVSELKKYLKDKHSANSNEIFEFIGYHLTQLNADAGYMYKTHRDLS